MKSHKLTDGTLDLFGLENDQFVSGYVDEHLLSVAQLGLYLVIFKLTIFYVFIAVHS